MKQSLLQCLRTAAVCWSHTARTMKGKDCKLIMKQMEEKLHRSKEQETRRWMKTVFLYKLQLYLLGDIIMRWTN